MRILADPDPQHCNEVCCMLGSFVVEPSGSQKSQEVPLWSTVRRGGGALGQGRGTLSNCLLFV